MLIEGDGGWGVGEVGGFWEEGVVAVVGIDEGLVAGQGTGALKGDFYRIACGFGVSGMAGVESEIGIAGHGSVDEACFGVEDEGGGGW